MNNSEYSEVVRRLEQLMLAHETACIALVAERRGKVELEQTIEMMRSFATLPMHDDITANTIIRDLRQERADLIAERDVLRHGVADLTRRLVDVELTRSNHAK